MTTPESLAAKIKFIREFFVDLAEKASYAQALYLARRRDEARLLACIYIESLGNGLYYPETPFSRNFCRALIEHSASERLSLVAGKWLLKRLPWKSIASPPRAELEGMLRAIDIDEAVLYGDFLLTARPLLSPKSFAVLEREIWRGTTAMVLYSELRSPGVHWFGSPGGISFSETTFRSLPLGRIGFEDLHAALETILEYTKGVSLSSGNWFGNAAVA